MSLVPVHRRAFSTEPPNYTEIAPVFERIQSVLDPSVIKKVNAVFVFAVENEGTWHVDLRNGSGSVGQGEPTCKADVTVTLSKEILLKMFNRELKPATAFMNGKVKFSGDMSKAMALESVMKAAR